MDNHDTILYDKKFECAHCGHSFASKKTRLRKSHPFQRDSDFCEHYENQTHNPILYHVIVCPQCGYSFNDQFRKSVLPQIEEKIEERITKHWTAKDYTGIRTIPEAIAAYKLAIFTADVRKEPHCVIAGLCLRLAWLYRYLKNESKELRFLNLALAEYEDSYTQGDYARAGMSELKLIYLIGELYRRTGDPGKALRYFSRVVEHPLRSNEPQTVNLAREQWQNMREDMKKAREAAANASENPTT
ncbi:DUF2225 domain-containing protein [Aneurinibacillus uraniidurans]|uniref:DUF2225 domain-containing protein n=1 Tax=Aneurinibacillus uraniidurans TaxID=2966586 RepID=UPI0023493FBB|nr:DUF2225 domain-containing protein [Aneurinibacillus sp. B1]WCN38464.1 DUF2225 domain-containing protein [Aneurinibacillus sp. B1]